MVNRSWGCQEILGGVFQHGRLKRLGFDGTQVRCWKLGLFAVTVRVDVLRPGTKEGVWLLGLNRIGTRLPR